MPQFLNPVIHQGQKRKSTDADLNASGKKRREAHVQSDETTEGTAKEQYWVVQWRSPQRKKNKTWDGDGVLALTGLSAKLFNDDGTMIATGQANVTHFESGTPITFGGKEMELDHELSRSDFMSGKCFSNGLFCSSTPAAYPKSSSLVKQFVPPRPGGSSLLKPSSAAVPNRGIPLYPVNLVSSSSSSAGVLDSPNAAIPDSYWTANWRRPQQKKHKTWDGDAYVTCTQGGKLRLISESGKILGTKFSSDGPLYSGYHTSIGTRDVELDAPVPQSSIPAASGFDADDSGLDPEACGPPLRKSWLSRASEPDPLSQQGSKSAPAVSSGFVAPISFYGKAPEKPKKGPLHDPSADDAIVMKAPTNQHEAKFNKKNLVVVPVVVDPVLGRRLRPHQVEGVRFLYECVMGLREHNGQGCILADEMGLGKTLQTITLVWTLLKQNPYSGIGPVIGKALIVCPVSLINNWKAEFHKWLGRDRVNVLVGDKDKAHIKQFINSRQQVLIIGYEKLRTVIQELSFCQPPIGLIICDEGHRLKSANNKTSTMFEALKTSRRVILSGTPIQNDLSEFHAMADFCNPGLLDNYNTFRRVYEVPILKSRTPDCTDKETELGEARSKQLLQISKSFVLRRDATILKSYLPPKYEYVVFITPTKLQLDILSKILSTDKLDRFIGNGLTDSLVLIGMLQKICNSPILLKATADKNKAKENQGGDVTNSVVREALECLPRKIHVEDVSLSGKLTALSNLLRTIRKNTDEKVVIVSHWTSTLNLIEAFCKKKSYTYLRLDGSTPSQKRQEYVNDFNKSSQGSRFLFLLSSKAGGVGINLIGASRLCLIDCDWNPSHDLQSMARIHRDGQKRPVYIYRFLTAGTIDEKIFQRQVTKLGLSASIMGTDTAQSKSDSFSPKELRDIFTIHPHTGCHTHDVLDCPCDGRDGSVPANEDNNDCMDDSDSDDEMDTRNGFVVASEINPGDLEKMDRAYRLKKKAQLASLGEWTHINGLERNAREKVKDEILGALLHNFKDEDDAKGSLEDSHNKTRLQSLLDVDVHTISTTDTCVEKPGVLSVHDVPGGTISFLFERFARMPDELQVE